jgi:hypothetical protein
MNITINGLQIKKYCAEDHLVHQKCPSEEAIETSSD